MKPVHWMLLGVLTVGVYAATMTRTTFLIMAATLALAFVMDKSSKIREGSVVYIGGMAAVAAGFVFSLYAAHISNWYELMPDWVVRIDRILTGRISSIYAFENGGGVLRNWKLFGDPNYVEYFDMGYVRLFFWYGIIPGACCMVLLFLLMRVCRTIKDTQGFVLVLSFALFTVVEAHAVSVYLARNYVLFCWERTGRQCFRWVGKRSGGGSCRGLFGSTVPKQRMAALGGKRRLAIAPKYRRRLQP